MVPNAEQVKRRCKARQQAGKAMTRASGGTPGSVLGTFSNFAQLSQFWLDPKDADVLKSGLLDVVNATESRPSKSQLNSDVMKAAFLLAYNTMEAAITTADSTADESKPLTLPMPIQVDRIKSSLTILGHSDTVISTIIDGARSLLQYRNLRDERYKTIEKLKKDLERVTKEIAEISKSFQSSKAWQAPRLTLNDSKVVVVEDEAIAREREQADKAIDDLKTVTALAQKWKKISGIDESHSEANAASRKANNHPIKPTPASQPKTPGSIPIEILDSIDGQDARVPCDRRK
ncbi:uncharacterized protein PV07_04415 [Cladophialophora immunda]|uniref:Uncharacterized protein n=1 Tax=Cladophialophora immunda TaxID=569365 RepID=A0A0D2B5M6_9EURO|nr:uncharacterized protein PV07_04415 [Cladophialophora immunda]KIW32902.1 hypothetical protein PV07_04415 [Cladophialophora immunda]